MTHSENHICYSDMRGITGRWIRGIRYPGKHFRRKSLSVIPDTDMQPDLVICFIRGDIYMHFQDFSHHHFVFDRIFNEI